MIDVFTFINGDIFHCEECEVIAINTTIVFKISLHSFTLQRHFHTHGIAHVMFVVLLIMIY